MTGMFLPRGERGTITREKLEKYLLNFDHIEGKAKAKFFSRFGYDLGNMVTFHKALLFHAVSNFVSSTSISEYGKKYVVTCNINTPDGRNPCINVVWIIQDDEIPYLVTAYPKNI